MLNSRPYARDVSLATAYAILNVRPAGIRLYSYIENCYVAFRICKPGHDDIAERPHEFTLLLVNERRTRAGEEALYVLSEVQAAQRSMG